MFRERFLISVMFVRNPVCVILAGCNIATWKERIMLYISLSFIGFLKELKSFRYVTLHEIFGTVIIT
jgi:hypothetical protein